MTSLRDSKVHSWPLKNSSWENIITWGEIVGQFWSCSGAFGHIPWSSSADRVDEDGGKWSKAPEQLLNRACGLCFILYSSLTFASSPQVPFSSCSRAFDHDLHQQMEFTIAHNIISMTTGQTLLKTSCISWLVRFCEPHMNLRWSSVWFSRSQVVQYRPRGPRGPSGPSPNLSVSTLEVWTIPRRSLCLSLCPSSISSSLEVSARRRRQLAAPTLRTDTLRYCSWTASFLTRHRPQVGIIWVWHL